MAINLNDADPGEISRAVPQVGDKRAHELAERRPFSSWEEVKKVPGFNDEMIEDMQEGGVILE